MPENHRPSDASSTWAALLTPSAPGAIAVLGLCGPATEAVLHRILRQAQRDELIVLQDGRPTFCRLVDAEGTLDDVVVIRFRRGMDLFAEIHTHGGMRVTQRALMLLEKEGVSIITADAYHLRTGAAHPVEHDVDRVLLSTEARRLVRWLLAQRRILPAYLDKLSSCPADEQAVFLERSRVAIRLLKGARVALIGPPNSGKSTLANRLIGRDRVITSNEPGTTRDWVSETALVGGWPIVLTDTAGIRETACAIEVEAIRRAQQQAAGADLVLIVLDATLPDQELHAVAQELLGTLPGDRPRILVANKSDLCTPPAGRASSREVKEIVDIYLSAQTGDGLDDLEKRIAAILGLDCLRDDLPTAFLRKHLEHD